MPGPGMRRDIVSSTTAPLIAEISESKANKHVVVTKESRTAVAEQFRTLRTNLLFRLAGTNNKVILLTSTMSGEGKSFGIAAHLTDNAARFFPSRGIAR